MKETLKIIKLIFQTSSTMWVWKKGFKAKANGWKWWEIWWDKNDLDVGRWWWQAKATGENLWWIIEIVDWESVT